MLAEFVEQLRKDFPEVKFLLGKKFSFRPPKTVYYEQFWDQKVLNDAGYYENKLKMTKNGEVEQKNCPNTLSVMLEQYKWLVLHELGHAQLKHCNFAADVVRLKMERAAWEEAQRIAYKMYSIEIDNDFIEEKLDTYREWLHSKSKCPKCGLTRFQGEDGVYVCPTCEMIQEKPRLL